MLKAVAIVIVAGAALPGTVHAQTVRAVDNIRGGTIQDDSAQVRNGWLDLGVGGGWVRLGEAATDQRGAFALDFSAGLWLRDRLGIGARLGGWTLEGFDPWNPEEGESLSEAFAVLRLRPHGGWSLIASLEGGWVSYTVNVPELALRGGDGLGGRISVAWDRPLSSTWVVSPALVGSWGEVAPDSALERSFTYWSVGALVRVMWCW